MNTTAMATIHGIDIGMTVDNDACTVTAVILPDVPWQDKPYDLRSTYATGFVLSGSHPSVSDAIATLWDVLQCVLSDYVYGTSEVQTVNDTITRETTS